MVEPSEYRVFSDEPPPSTLTEDEKKVASGLHPGLGVFLAFVILMGLVLISDQLLNLISPLPRPHDNTGGVIAGICILVSLSLVYMLHRFLLKRERRKMEQEKANSNSRIYNQYADNLTASLNANLKQSQSMFAELPDLLKEASEWLEDAQKDYKDNAFAPFWEDVEEVVRCLGSFYDNVRSLSKNARDYYSSLKGRSHSFPVFPVQQRNIPDPMPVVEEFHRIVRLGQTNFQFANIWEHRLTRKVMIAGFQTLGNAVNNLSDTLEASMSYLQGAVSSDIVRLVEEEISTRGIIDKHAVEQNRMLDNIQQSRKPLA